MWILQIYYETIRRIPAGEELLLGNKDPIQLDGSGMEQQSQNSLNFSATDEDRERDNNGNTSLGGSSSGAGGLLALSVGGLSGGSPGGKHSGMDEDTDEEDDENGRKCLKCDKIFHDIYT